MRDSPEKYKADKEAIARQAGDVGYKNPLYTKMDNGHIKINHIELVNTMMKFINSIPINPLIKRIMTMRLSGTYKNPKPMTPMQVAIMLGMRQDDVMAYEAEGVSLCGKYLTKYSLQDGINKFNMDTKAQNEAKLSRVNSREETAKGDDNG